MSRIDYGKTACIACGAEFVRKAKNHVYCRIECRASYFAEEVKVRPVRYRKMVRRRSRGPDKRKLVYEYFRSADLTLDVMKGLVSGNTLDFIETVWDKTLSDLTSKQLLYALGLHRRYRNMSIVTGAKSEHSKSY